MNPKSTSRLLTKWLAMAVGVALVVMVLPADAQEKPKKKAPPAPPKKMDIIEVFPTQNYTLVQLEFLDAKGKPTKVETGTFSWTSNFLVDKSKRAKEREAPLTDTERVQYRNGRYSLKLPGLKKVCPPSVARIKITFVSKSPKLKFVKNWSKKADCK